MLSILLSVLNICIINSFLSGNLDNQEYYSDKPVKIERLELPDNSILFKILDDVFSESEKPKSGKNRIFRLEMDKFHSGVKLVIDEEEGNSVGESDSFFGYFVYGNDTIVVVNNKGTLNLNYSVNPHPIYLKTHSLLKWDPEEWVYYVKGNVFARYTESLGWIWHIEPEEFKNFTLHKYFLTAPKRKHE